MDLFLQANEVLEAKHVPVFLSLLGGPTYGLLRNLCSPDKPHSKTYEQLTDLLFRHYEPEPLIIAKHFTFTAVTRLQENLLPNTLLN